MYKDKDSTMKSFEMHQRIHRKYWFKYLDLQKRYPSCDTDPLKSVKIILLLKGSSHQIRSGPESDMAG